MINEINSFNTNEKDLLALGKIEGQQISHVNDKQNAVNVLQNEINKQVMVFLSKIKIGDILTGQLISQEGQTMLKLPNGMQFSANCLQQIPEQKMMDFLVTGKECQHLQLQLQPTSTVEVSQEQTIMTQAANELGIEESGRTQNVMSQFMAKQLPLLKQQLVQVMQFAKYLDMPTEALTNLLAQKQPLISEEGQLLSTYKGKEIEQLTTQLEQILENISSDGQKPLSHVITHTFDSKEILSFLKKDGEMPNPFLTEGTNEQDHREGVKNQRSLVTEPIVKEQIEGQPEKPLFEKGLFDKGNEGLLIDKLLLGKNTDGLKRLLKDLVREKLTVHLLEGNEEQEVEKLSKAAEVIKKVAENIKESKLEGIDYAKLQQFEQLGEVINKFNAHAQYFCFPLQINGEKAEGELYFFKPKKNKKNQQNGMYLVLALNMPHLNKIEIHVKEKGEHIDLMIKVKNQEMKDLISAHQSALEALIADTVFKLGEVQCQLTEAENPKVTYSSYEALTRLDARV